MEEKPQPTAKPNISRSVGVSLLIAAMVFFVLWYFGFPKPFYDDLFYLGPSLNLAQGGDLSNPLLARQLLPTHYFFLYPPLTAHLFAGWFKVVGISGASATGYVMLMWFVIASSTIALLRRYAAPVWVEWLVPLGVSVAFLPTGMRPEPATFALVMAGFAVLECAPRRAPVMFAGFLLLFLGTSASPRIAPFGVALTAYIAWRFWRAPVAERPNFVKLFAVAGLAAVITGFTFLCMIHFHLREFLAELHLHAAARETERFAKFTHFIAHQRVTVWPIWIIFLGLVAAAFRRLNDPLVHIGLLSALMMPVELTMADLNPHLIWFMILALLVLAAPAARALSRKFELMLAIVMLGALLLANGKAIFYIGGVATGQIKQDVGDNGEQLRALRPTPEHPILVDPDAARYLFDYRIPAGCVDLNFGTIFPGSFVTTQPLRPGDLYFVCVSGYGGLVRDTHLPRLNEPPWSPARLAIFEFERHPNRVYLVRMEDCNGVRPEAVQIAPKFK